MTSPMRDVLRQFNSLNTEIQGLYHDACVKLGISDSAGYILYTLVEFGEGCTPSDVYHAYGISRQTVHSSLNNLVRKEVIELRKGTGKEHKIFLTDKGKKVVQERVIPIIEIENNLLDDWSDMEKLELLRLLSKYRDGFKERISMLQAINEPL